MLILVILSVWIFLGSLALWARARPAGVSVVLGGAVLAVAQVVGVMLTAGLLGLMQREVILGIHVLLNTVFIIWGRSGLRDLLLRWASDIPVVWRDLRHSPGALLVLTATSVVGIGILGLGWFMPPTDFDGLAQHIPIASFFLQNGSILPIDTPYRGIRAYPATGSLLMAWSMLVAGNDVAVDLVQWPFWLMGLLALYQIARIVGASRANATLGSAVFALAPVVLLQARAAYVDLILAGLVLCALALLLDRSLPARWIAISLGCTLGILSGVKYAGLIYVVLLGLGLLGRLWIDRRERWRALLADVGVVAVLGLALGGYWYLRNWIGSGNPVWPMTLQLGGWRVFDGVWTTAAFYQDALPPGLAPLPYLLQLWTVWRDSAAQFAADMRLGGLGPLWLAIGLPCTVVYGVQSLRHRDRRALAVLGFALAAFVLTPANWHTRYVIAPIAIGGVAAASVLGWLDRWPYRIMQSLVVGLGLYGIALTLFAGPISAADVDLFTRLPADERRSVFADQVAAVDPAMRWFSQNVSDSAITAYGWNGVILYPFWEHAPQRKLIYVPPVDPPVWFDELYRRGAEYLIARRDSAEAQSAGRDPRFYPEYSDNAYAIYSLHP
jgi:hypothetical protein